ncbi:hypothetical protein ACFY97_04375 [Streptomyces klenkii]
MAPGVREAFQQLHVQYGGGDEASATAWLRGLITAGRYAEDICAGS